MDELVKKYLKPRRKRNGRLVVEFHTGFQLHDGGTKEEAIEILKRSIRTWEKTALGHIDHLNGKRHEHFCKNCEQKNIQ